MATYSLDQLINKRIFVTGKVPLYRHMFSKTPMYTVNPGQSIGVVYSWVMDKATGVYWLQFLDSNQKSYYASTTDLKGKLSFTELKHDGAKTTEEKYTEEKEAAEKDADPIEYYIKKYGKWVLITAIGYALITKRN